MCELAVNGIGKGIMTFTDRCQTFTVKVEPEELKAGMNEFSFINRSIPLESEDSGKKSPYILMDFLRLEMKAVPPGFVVILK
jgi:hypothetical protein